MKEDSTRSSRPSRRALRVFRAVALYPAAFVAARFGPIVLKEAIRPPVGVRTKFYTVLVLVPAVFLILGLLKGWRVLIIHAALVIALALWLVFTYQEGVMNLSRQLMHDDVPPKLPYLYAAGAASYLCVLIWKQKRRRTTAVQDDFQQSSRADSQDAATRP